MPKIALRTVILAAVLLSFIQLAFFIGALTTPAPTPTQSELVKLAEVQAASAPIRLDAHGIGTQVISGTAITIKLEPFPVTANQAVTITLVPLTVQSLQVTDIRPALGVAPLGSTGVVAYPMTRRPDGAYSTSGTLFPSPGLWRARIIFTIDGVPDFVTLLSVDVTK